MWKRRVGLVVMVFLICFLLTKLEVIKCFVIMITYNTHMIKSYSCDPIVYPILFTSSPFTSQPPCQDHHLHYHLNRVFWKRFTLSLDQISSWLWLMDEQPKGNSYASIGWETSYLKMRKKEEILPTIPTGRRAFTGGKRSDFYRRLLYPGRGWLGCRFQRANTSGGRGAYSLYKQTIKKKNVVFEDQ